MRLKTLRAANAHTLKQSSKKVPQSARQDYGIWKDEIERWAQNDKATEETKFDFVK